MKFNKYLLMSIGAASLTFGSLTSCMEEVEPTDYAIEKQIQESPSAAEAMLMAMPAYANEIWMTGYNSNWHNCFGYAAMMHIRNVMGADLTNNNGDGYGSHFYYWARNKAMDEAKIFGQFIWNYYYGYVMTTNTLIGGIDETNATDDQLGYLGAGLAFRAMLYLDLARMYEFLPNDKTSNINKDGNNVLNLTVPIVKDGMEVDAARSNPRATRDSMYNFIKEDLEKAEKYIVNLKDTKGKVLPDLGCVYGLQARLNMWVENYAEAQKYARLAIDNASGHVMSKEECLSTTSGFNVVDPWMWGSQLTSESDPVKTGIINWISWMSNETTFGYKGVGTGMYTCIDKNFYERIGDDDFRKDMFKAPKDRPDLGARNVYLMPQLATFDEESDYYMPAYASLKFRPAQGNTDDYSTGAACAYPLMRVEEMYFIEAEAAAHQNAAEGLSLLTEFMKNYRNAKYTPKAVEQADIIDEIYFQKSIELWGEGQSFFDVKRLNKSVTRGYEGTNWGDDLTRLNTNGRPAWMNIVIVQSEKNNNKALVGMNNPDPTDAYIPWVAEN